MNIFFYIFFLSMPSVFTRGPEGERVRRFPPIGKSQRRGPRGIAREMRTFFQIRASERSEKKRASQPPAKRVS